MLRSAGIHSSDQVVGFVGPIKQEFAQADTLGRQCLGRHLPSLRRSLNLQCALDKPPRKACEDTLAEAYGGSETQPDFLHTTLPASLMQAGDIVGENCLV